jgi:cell division protein FtsQ
MLPARTEVQVIAGLSKAQVLNCAGISEGAVFVSINAATAEQKLSDYYLVESAKVVKRFPDRVSIFLVPRQVAVIAIAKVNGRSLPVYFDRYGVAFKIGNSAGEAIPAGLPVISGVLNDNLSLRLGMKASAAYLPVFSRIGAISDEDPNIWRTISEIGIAKKGGDMFDLILYPVHNPIKLRMGSDISKENIYYALIMSDVYGQPGADNPVEIDVRSGLGVLIMEAN